MEIYLFHFFELASFIFAVIFYKDLKKFKMGGYVPYLFMVCTVEICAAYIEWFGLTRNLFLYNIYFIIATAFNAAIFLPILNLSRFQRRIYIAVVVSAVAFMIYNILFYQGFINSDTYSCAVNTSVNILLSMCLLVKLFMDDDTNIKMIDHPYFWLASSTLIFNLGDLLISGLHDYILAHRIMVGNAMLYNFIMPLLCDFWYGSFCYAFILCRKQTIRQSIDLQNPAA